MAQRPYKFLDAFEKEDHQIFFGREREVEEVHSRLFYGNLLVLYGASGTGKTSILKCGLYNKIPDSDWKPVIIRRKQNIIDSIGSELKKLAITPLKEDQDISKKLHSIYLDYLTPVFMIFDQLEELFIFGSKREKEEFVDIISRIKKDPEKNIKLIFIIREEFLANLSIFESHIPHILDNRYRIERMGHSHLLEVIEHPAEVCGVQLDEEFAEKAIEKISDDKGNAELTYIQVLMDHLYKIAESRNPEEIRISIDDLNQLGHLGNLMSKFLDEQLSAMKNSRLGEDVLKTMISPDGTKKPMQLDDIQQGLSAMGKQIPQTELLQIVQYFVNVRIFREKDENGYYELRHDSLAKRIYDRMTLVERELIEIRQFLDQAYDQYCRRKLLLRKEDLQYIAPYEPHMYLPTEIADFVHASRKYVRRSKRRRLGIAFAMMTILLIVLSGLTFWALMEKEKSHQSYLQAKASNFTYLSQSFIGSDPTLALRLAEYAVSLVPNNQGIYRNLNRIYYDYHFYKIRARIDEEFWSADIPEEKSLIMTGSRDLAQLRDESGNIIHELGGHKGWVGAVSISPDKKMMASGDENGTIRMWDNKGNLLQELTNHTDHIYSLSFNRSGTLLLSGSEDGTARLWSIDGQEMLKLQGRGRAILSAIFTQDESAIILASECGMIRIADPDGYLIHSFQAHQACITTVSVSNNGNYIVTASEDQTARLWTTDGRLLQVFSGHEDWVTDVNFSPDDQFIVTASADGTARTWHVNGDMLQVLTGHKNTVVTARFSQDGQYVFTAALDRTIRQWELQKRELQRYEDTSSPILAVAISPNGKYVLTGSDDKIVRLYDRKGNILQRFTAHKAYVRAVAFSPQGEHILTGSGDRTAKLWDMNGNVLQVFTGHERSITSLSFCPEGKFVLTGSDDRTARLWDIDGNHLQTFAGHKARVSAVGFLKNGKYVITASWDNTCRKYDLEGTLKHVFRSHDSHITTMAVSHDGKRIITGSWDRTARIWDSYGNVIQVFEGHDANVSAVAFAPDASRIVTGSFDNTVRTWDMNGNMQQLFDGHRDHITAVAYDFDGQSVISSSWDYTARRWQLIPTHEVFYKNNGYENLSIGQQIEFGILDHEQLLRQLNDEELVMAFLYYQETADRLDTETAVDYLRKAADVLTRLRQNHYNQEVYKELKELLYSSNGDYLY